MKCTLLFLSMAFCGIANAQTGSLDLSFDSDGKVTTDIGTRNDVAKSIAIQSDGKIVVAGFSENSTDRDFSVVIGNSLKICFDANTYQFKRELSSVQEFI